MKKTFRKKHVSIVRRISVMNIGVFIIACVLSILATLLLNVQYHVSRDGKMMNVYISDTMNSVDNMLKDMGRVSLIAFSDQTVQGILKGSDYTLKEQLENEEYMSKLYSSMISIRDDVKGIYIFNLNDLIFYSDQNNPTLGLQWNVTDFFRTVKENSDLSTNISGCHMYVSGLPSGLGYSTIYTKNTYLSSNIYLVRPIRSFSPFEVIGYIAIRTPVNTIRNICDKYLQDEVTYLYIDENNKIACSTEDTNIGQKIEECYPQISEKLDGSGGNFKVELQGRDYLCAAQTSPYSKMTLVTLKSYRSIIKELNPLILTCAMITVISAMVVLIMVYRLTKRNLRRLTDFSVELQNFQPDDLNRHYEVGYPDEVGVLKDSFNKMIGKLNDLVILEYQARDELQKAEISEQKMAMLYLEQQINPHFLYNTLDMIRMKAALNGDGEVAQMLIRLVKFYRLSTKIHSSYVSVRTELEMLDAYMALMHYRYNELVYEVNAQEEMLDLEIPSFTLQPLLENCLLHGLKDKGYKGRIELNVFCTREKDYRTLHIQVEDDGIGISVKKLNELNEYAFSDAEELLHAQFENPAEASHLGILNVISRLKLFYRDQCTIRYSRNESGGTTVEIIIQIED